MTSPTDEPEPRGPRVTAVLLVHDGEAWLAETIGCLTAQRQAADRIIVVDIGSRDTSREVLTGTLGSPEVVEVPREAGGGEAVAAALALDDSDDAEWLWLLTDDTAPDPDALAELLERVDASPSIWQVGPKSHSWTDGRLLEAGVTVDGTGHRDIGVDGPELDQGQRDEADDVLAVATPGSLVRRKAWDALGGLDNLWSPFGDDIDLGWRVNAAGGRVVVAPRAVVRRQASPGEGRYAAIGEPTALADRRRLGMALLLANTSGWRLPLVLAHLLIGGLLRSLGLLLGGSPSRARAEVVAVAGVLRSLPAILRAGARRRDTRELRRHDLRHLFPSSAARWRRSPLVAGLLRSGKDNETARTGSSYETGPVSEESESLEAGESRIGGFLRRPASVLFLAMTLVALVAERGVLSITLHGGRLLPTSGGASDLWSAYLSTWHPVSVGSTTTPAPSLAVLAVLSSIVAGKVGLAVAVILLGAVPLSALTSYLSLRAVTRNTRVRIWVSVVYALLPAVTGAVADGRVDIALTAILLPLVIRAAAATLKSPPGWHWRAGWNSPVGAGLLLALVASLAPVLWVAAVPLLVAGCLLARRPGGTAATTARRGVAALVMLAVAPLVLLPWTAHVATHPVLLLTGSGLPERFASVHPPSGLSLLLQRAGGAGQPPVWVGVPLVVAAVLGLRRTRRVPVARVGALLMIVGIAGAVAVSRGVGVTPGLADSRHWPGALLLLAGAGALLAATVAATGAGSALTGHSFGWRQVGVAGLVALSVVGTVMLAGAWVVRGANGPLSGSSASLLPLFTQVELAQPNSPRALVIRADGAGVFSYALVRRPVGPRLGDADVAPAGDDRASVRLAGVVRDVAAGLPGAGGELQQFDIGYVVVPSDSVSELAPRLAQASTLTVAPAPGATVYRSALPTGELVLLPAGEATAALSGTATGAASALVLHASSSGSADVTVPPGPAGRLVVLAEPVDSHWHATVGTTTLPGRTAYGWAQAFELPASGGRLQIGYHNQRRGVLLWLELAALVVTGLAALPLPRRAKPAGEVS